MYLLINVNFLCLCLIASASAVFSYYPSQHQQQSQSQLQPTVGLFVADSDKLSPAYHGYQIAFSKYNWTVVEISTSGSLQLMRQTCGLLHQGVYAFFTTADNAYITSISNTFDIPLFTSKRLDNGGSIAAGYGNLGPSFAGAGIGSVPPTTTTTSTTTASKPAQPLPPHSVQLPSSYTFSTGMSSRHWNRFLKEFLKFLHIDTVAIFYQDDEGLRKLSAILNMPETLSTLKTAIVRKITFARGDPGMVDYGSFQEHQLGAAVGIQSAEPASAGMGVDPGFGGTDDYQDYQTQPTTPSMRTKSSKTADKLRYVLQEVRKKVKTLFVDCALENVATLLENVQHEGINDHHFVFTNLDSRQLDLKKFSNLNLTFIGLKSSADLSEQGFAMDNVAAFSKALHSFNPLLLNPPGNLSCDLALPWSSGLTLINYISSVSLQNGTTGDIKFSEGERVNIELDVLRMDLDGLLISVGSWSIENGLSINQSFSIHVSTNVTLIVTTVLEMPYVQLRPNQTGNARFEGFSIDLLKLIANQVGFKFIIDYESRYGAMDYETGEWNGVVRQLLDKKADLGIGSMTINHARLTVIDFTKPFMHLGISILFKVPKRPPAKMFSFLTPLAFEIWISIIFSYVFVSLTMYFVSRFSGEEWKHFGLANAFWYPIGTLMQQGSDLNPRKISTRLVAGFWWFFSLVMISSYTANLAAFLTVERMSTPIESAEGLAEQSEIAYGTLESGSTMTFFRDSKMEPFQRMWRFMESRKPSVFVSTYEEGIRRVLEEDNYAFLMESSMLDYVVHQNCNLTQIGGELDSKGYGIATPIGSPWRDKISLAILEMTEKGIIQSLYNKWWKSTSVHSTNECSSDMKKDAQKASALGVDSIGGVFIVLSIGLFIAILVSIIEFCYINKSKSISVCSEMAKECRFAIRCAGPRRRPALIRYCENCSLDAGTAGGGGKGGVSGHGPHHHRPFTPPPCHDYHTYPHRHRQSLQAFNLNGI